MIRTALIIIAMVSLLSACDTGGRTAEGPASGRQPTSRNDKSLQAVQDAGRPEITTDGISRDVVGWVVEIEELTGSGPADKWTFEANEYRRVDIVERHATAAGLDLLVFVLSRSNPKPDEETVQVTGQLGLHYEWRDGKWVLRGIDNVSFRYSLGVAT